jgi:hypothetical protein
MSIISAGGAVVGAGGPTQYEISRSLRFNSADSAYLDRTPASTSNRTTWTWSGWIKRGALSGTFGIFGAGTDNGTNRTLFWFTSANQLIYQEGNSSLRTTAAVFRDPSAWGHLVVTVDNGNATAANRILIYWNGVLQATTGSGDPGSTQMNLVSVAMKIGTRTNPPTSEYFDGYLTEINFIDGQALTPSSFGEFNADTGVWQPIEYTGTYGTNGFYLNFSDNSTTDALGTDFSGNGNTWDDYGFSVTAGAGNDSLVDSPTRYGTDTGVGGEVRGNYCTLNPLNKTSGCTLANGNLNTSATAATNSCVGTMGMSSGKWYYEVTVGTGQQQIIGISTISSMNTADVFNGNYSYGYYGSNGNKYVNGSASAYGATFTGADVIGVAVNIDSNEITFYKNNSSQGTISLQSGQTYFPAHGHYQSSANNCDYNFGQRPFASTAPAGFKALVTTNLP